MPDLNRRVERSKYYVKKFQKVCCLALALTISATVSLPAFAAERKTTSSLKNEVVLQRQTGIETVKLPANISESKLLELKTNIQKYGSQRLSQKEVNNINARAGSNGLVYGPWFGGVSHYYAMSVDESVISLRYALSFYVKPGQWVKATMAKQYREVKYRDGSFAYFQTGFFANNLNVANKSYGSPVTIFSGELD